MKTNRNLLKEAIADAKAVKETAIANAKAALEEAFTPHLRELFASKLEEMELDEEAEEVDEMMTDNEMEEAKVKETSKMKEEMDLEELLAELNEAEEEGEAEEKEEEGEAEEEAEEEVEVSEMSEDDLKTFIEDVIKDMVSAGELETGEKEAEAGTEEAETMEEDLDEEINLEELLAEVEKEKMEEAEINEGMLSPELAAALTAFGIPAISLLVAKGTEAIDKAAAEDNKIAIGIKNFIDKVGKLGAAGKAGIKEETAELQEAYSTIKTLKRELHEINLLNAKLLYTNKIFKAKNLTDPQKVKVLENFDKATTVNEVKLVFETLTENLNNNKTNVNESKMRGFASKTIAPVVNKKQPIIESNDAFARMQRLAGLR
jgi:hypothetical protein